MRRNSGLSHLPAHIADRKIYFGALTDNTAQVHYTMEGNIAAVAETDDYQQGQVIVFNETDNKVRPYVEGETLGEDETVVGVLAQSVGFDEFYVVDEEGNKTANDFQVTVYTGGEFIKSYLSELDEDAETALGGVTLTRDVNCCPGGEVFKF